MELKKMNWNTLKKKLMKLNLTKFLFTLVEHVRNITCNLKIKKEIQDTPRGFILSVTNV